MRVSNLDEETLEKYMKAGSVARGALDLAIDIVKPKKRINLYELCIKVERYVISRGCKLAFPCNISLNEVAAHSTPYRDEEVIFEEGLLKIDVGAMVDGYIADNAVTVARGYEYEKISEVNKEILEEVIKMFRPGTSLGDIGEFIENRAREFGYKPISNLTGHLVNKYRLHAGKSVPNIKQFTLSKTQMGEVYAIEPFLTFRDGEGHVIEGSETRIYSLTKLKKIKDKTLNQIKIYIFNKYGFLPFTPRWMEEIYGDEIYKYIQSLHREGYLKRYPILIEKSGKYISQYEDTVIVTDDEPVIITRKK